MRKGAIKSKLNPIFDRNVAGRIVRTLSLADAMGFTTQEQVYRPDLNSVLHVAKKIAKAGIGRQAVALLEAIKNVESAEEAVALLGQLEEAMQESPVPATEWCRMEEIFGTDMLARLVGTSPASIRRYRGLERDTPDDIAARLHCLALLVADLAGTYNDIGIRRWFMRQRQPLGGRAPVDILSGKWGPDDPDVAIVRSLARSLLDAAAT